MLNNERRLPLGLTHRGAWLTVVILAGLVRLIPVLFSTVARGDGLTRTLYAWQFSQHPHWQGLTGVWLPLHWYCFGSLLMIWNNPLGLAKVLGWLTGTGTVALYFSLVRRIHGTQAALWGGVLMSLYWFHIWLTPTNFVDIYVLFLYVAAIYFSVRTQQSGQLKSRLVFACCAGVCVGITILLRHEAKLAAAAIAVWMLVVVNWRSAIAFCVVTGVPVLAQFVEYRSQGKGLLGDFAKASELQQAAAAFSGSGAVQGLLRWVKLTAGSPTLFVFIPGLMAMWWKRREAIRDPLALFFVLFTCFYLFLTITKGWSPQGRYLMLYFFGLFGYAGVVYSRLAASGRHLALAALLVLYVGNQAGAWYIRNDKQVLGALPIQLDSREQRAVNGFYDTLPRPTSEVFVDLTEAEWWSFRVTLAERNEWDQFDKHIFRAVEEQQLLIERGFADFDPSRATILLVRPQSKMYFAMQNYFPQLHLQMLKQVGNVGIFRITKQV